MSLEGDFVGVGVDAALHGQTNHSARSARTPQGTEANPNPEHPSGGDVGPPAPPARAHHVSFAPAPFRVTLHEEQEEQPASPTHPSQPPPQQQPLLPTSSHKGAGTAQGHRRRTSMGACVMHRTASFTHKRPFIDLTRTNPSIPHSTALAGSIVKRGRGRGLVVSLSPHTEINRLRRLVLRGEWAWEHYAAQRHRHYQQQQQH